MKKTLLPITILAIIIGLFSWAYYNYYKEKTIINPITGLPITEIPVIIEEQQAEDSRAIYEQEQKQETPQNEPDCPEEQPCKG